MSIDRAENRNNSPDDENALGIVERGMTDRYLGQIAALFSDVLKQEADTQSEADDKPALSDTARDADESIPQESLLEKAVPKKHTPKRTSPNYSQGFVAIPDIEPLLPAPERERFDHVDVFNVAQRPGSVTKSELLGAINSMWGRAVDSNILDKAKVDFLRHRFEGRPDQEGTRERKDNPLKLLENLASVYPGRLADDRYPNARLMRSMVKNFARGHTIYELKETTPHNAPVMLLLAGAISEILKTREKAGLKER